MSLSPRQQRRTSWVVPAAALLWLSAPCGRASAETVDPPDTTLWSIPTPADEELLLASTARRRIDDDEDAWRQKEDWWKDPLALFDDNDNLIVEEDDEPIKESLPEEEQEDADPYDFMNALKRAMPVKTALEEEEEGEQEEDDEEDETEDEEEVDDKVDEEEPEEEPVETVLQTKPVAVKKKIQRTKHVKKAAKSKAVVAKPDDTEEEEVIETPVDNLQEAIKSRLVQESPARAPSGSALAAPLAALSALLPSSLSSHVAKPGSPLHLLAAAYLIKNLIWKPLTSQWQAHGGRLFGVDDRAAQESPRRARKPSRRRSTKTSPATATTAPRKRSPVVRLTPDGRYTDEPVDGEEDDSEYEGETEQAVQAAESQAAQPVETESPEPETLSKLPAPTLPSSRQARDRGWFGHVQSFWHRPRLPSARQLYDQVQLLEDQIQQLQAQKSTVDSAYERASWELQSAQSELTALKSTTGYLQAQLRDNEDMMQRVVKAERRKAKDELVKMKEAMVRVVEQERQAMREEFMKQAAELESMVLPKPNQTTTSITANEVY